MELQRTGRQNPKWYLAFPQAMPASAMAMFSSANSRAIWESVRGSPSLTCPAIRFQKPAVLPLPKSAILCGKEDVGLVAMKGGPAGKGILRPYGLHLVENPRG